MVVTFQFKSKRKRYEYGNTNLREISCGQRMKHDISHKDGPVDERWGQFKMTGCQNKVDN